MTSSIFVGGGGKDYAEAQSLALKLANRHGMIAGATGTGKTVTLQILAEGFSAAGVPVFAPDIKGDLSGLAKAGSPDSKLHEPFMKRANQIGFSDFGYEDFPVTFWDVFGEAGHPVRATISDLGPLLISRLLDLTEVQEGIINIAFRLSDEQGLALLDLKDLRQMLIWIGENAGELTLKYGNISAASVGAIQRRLLVIENQGAGAFFGEPSLKLSDLMQTTPNGRGRINILHAESLMESPRLYATVLLWLMSELFESLPEVGDPEKPKFVLFFDEAHLIFDDAPKALIDKVEQVARLIRSKGVGVYFISQNPDDVPEDILAQLGNRVQHALRAYTPREQKALKAAAESFRENPDFDSAEVIGQLGVGEALVSTLANKGVPSVVQRTLIRPPSSQLGPITAEERKAFIANSPMFGAYEEPLDRESAYEILTARADEAAKEAAEAEAAEEKAEEFKRARRYQIDWDMPAAEKPKSRSRRSDTATEAFAKSMMRSLGTKTGTAIVRGVMGSLFKGR
ncbi:helicase HerA-like domain-containing protein [Paracoccaceae bacterium GXU_MW_L88]